MLDVMRDLEFVRAYINDMLCITKDTFTDHLNKLPEVLSRLRKAELQVNLKKSFIAHTELEYLGYWITHSGIKPLTKKDRSHSETGSTQDMPQTA